MLTLKLSLAEHSSHACKYGKESCTPWIKNHINCNISLSFFSSSSDPEISAYRFSVIPYFTLLFLSRSLSLLTASTFLTLTMPLKPNIRSVFAAAGITELQKAKAHITLVRVWLENGFHLDEITFHISRAEHSKPKAMLGLLCMSFYNGNI